MTDPKRELLRHTLATLAYRGGKTARGAPDGFTDFQIARGCRTPGQILAHIGDLRRPAGAPVKGENYFRAGIMAGRVGPDQAAPVQEFE